MLTRFITEVNTRFNPFSLRSRATRLFLSNLPPNARAMGMQINTVLLPRTSTEPNSISVKFSAAAPCPHVAPTPLITAAEDGKEMKLDSETMGIKSIIEEVDRHSRFLQKQADLADG
ncbi:39S ribosomal protein L53/MRP-L53-domain-containing protein [Xylariaceae sp. FL0255]|nr:39S ribosomal protein L53/MRP-L53-domain-containing protein [Xylariaceae sp. FL0255]